VIISKPGARDAGGRLAWVRNLRPPGCDDITMTKVTEVTTARMEAVILSRRLFLPTGRACRKVLRGRR